MLSEIGVGAVVPLEYLRVLLGFQPVVFVKVLALLCLAGCKRGAYVCLGAGAKFVTALKDDTKVLIIPGIFSALLVAALVDFIKSKSMTMLTEVTVCIIAAQVAWSIFQTARNFANEASA